MTLLEVMITIAILTIGVVGVMGGVAAAQRISGINQSQAQLEPAMRQLSDFVRDSSTQGLGYKLCANLTNNKYSLAGLGAAPAGLQWSITDVAVSATNGGTRAGVPTSPIQTCGSGGDWGVQEITLQVKNASHSLTRIIWKAWKAPG